MVDTLIVVAGCLLAFLLGAYVRAPFRLIRQVGEQQITQALSAEEVEQKEKLKKQWESLLTFDGEQVSD